jgi:hypothetical protein
MFIYRAELDDGGGPFYHRDGTPRNINMPVFKGDNNILYGADSIENLTKLIENYGFNIKDFDIKQYQSENILSYNKRNGHIIFKI